MESSQTQATGWDIIEATRASNFFYYLIFLI